MKSYKTYLEALLENPRATIHTDGTHFYPKDYLELFTWECDTSVYFTEEVHEKIRDFNGEALYKLTQTLWRSIDVSHDSIDYETELKCLDTKELYKRLAEELDFKGSDHGY